MFYSGDFYVVYLRKERYIITYSSVLFLYVNLSYCLCHFLSSEQTSVSIYCKAGKPAINSLCLYLFRKVLLSLSLLKDSFTWLPVFFPLQLFEYTIPLPLSSTVSEKKLAVNHIFFLSIYKIFYSMKNSVVHLSQTCNRYPKSMTFLIWLLCQLEVWRHFWTAKKIWAYITNSKIS